ASLCRHFLSGNHTGPPTEVDPEAFTEFCDCVRIGGRPQRQVSPKLATGEFTLKCCDRVFSAGSYHKVIPTNGPQHVRLENAGKIETTATGRVRNHARGRELSFDEYGGVNGRQDSERLAKGARPI